MRSSKGWNEKVENGSCDFYGGVSKDYVRCKRWGKSITNFLHMQVDGYFFDINQICTNK